MALGFLPSAERLLQGTLSDTLTALATEMTVSNPPSVNELPTYIEIDPDSVDNRETVRVTDVNSNVCTIERGVYSSGVGIAHDPQTPYKQKIASVAWQRIIDTITAGFMMVDPSLVISRTDADTFQINGADYTAYFTVGRIVRFNENDANVGVVLNSSLVSGNTVVNLQSGSVANPLTAIELSIAPRGGTNLYAYPSSVQAGSYQYAADAGSNDTYAITLSPVPTAYTAGMVVVFKANTANTGAATLNVNGLGAKTIKKHHDKDLNDNDIESGSVCAVVYDGTNFQLISSLATTIPKVWTDDSDGATITFDIATSDKHRVTLGGNRTLALSNVKVGDAFVIRLLQDGTGGRTVTWFSTIKWANGVAPTLSGIDKADVFGFICTGTNTYDGFVIGQNL